MMPWVWFLISGLTAAVGSALLVADRGQQSAQQRERRRWAALRGWRFVLSDPLFTQRWRHGVIADAGVARDLVTGNLFTRLGRRVVQVFDHEQAGQVSSVVVAVQRRIRDADLVVELWLPDQPLPQDPQLTRLGIVGERIAVVSDPNRARTLMTADFVFAANSLGADIAVAWLEQDWVLAAAPCTATPTRLERLLRALGEIADLLDVPPADETADTTAIADRADLSRWATSERLLPD
ncbi:MAG TPA: hypothetical protein VN748_10495 [Pseudonocardiaceae bacterium]|nr:hypothetical protein [Pseudonocardiaceae bacterium]